ncbi:hypothetical protein JCM10296v2_000926 [Rhodotorula toruloides]
MPNNWWYDGDYDVWVCDECNGREFVNWSALVKHLEMSRNHNFCTDCERDFVSWPALRSHWANSSSHSFCTLCDTHFDNDELLHDHDIYDHFPCQGCDQIFASELGRFEHGRQSHPFCIEHRRAFLSQANLRAHLESSAHIQARIPCAAGCGRKFIDYSAMVLHLEAGSCPSGWTRQKIDYKLRSLPAARPYMTSSQRLIAGPTTQTRSSWVATEDSYNDWEQAYECFFCHRLFNSLAGLNQHLTSPRHAYATETGRNGEKLYKCPMDNCGRNFSTFSGLVQHAERGGCGVLQFRLQKALDGLTMSMRALTW